MLGNLCVCVFVHYTCPHVCVHTDYGNVAAADAHTRVYICVCGLTLLAQCRSLLQPISLSAVTPFVCLQHRRVTGAVLSAARVGSDRDILRRNTRTHTHTHTHTQSTSTENTSGNKANKYKQAHHNELNSSGSFVWINWSDLLRAGWFGASINTLWLATVSATALVPERSLSFSLVTLASL